MHAVATWYAALQRDVRCSMFSYVATCRSTSRLVACCNAQHATCHVACLHAASWAFAFQCVSLDGVHVACGAASKAVPCDRGTMYAAGPTLGCLHRNCLQSRAFIHNATCANRVSCAHAVVPPAHCAVQARALCGDAARLRRSGQTLRRVDRGTSTADSNATDAWHGMRNMNAWHGSAAVKGRSLF